MKFGVAFSNAGPLAYPEPFAALVQTAEECGFESIWTVEHVVVPVGYRSRYPYSPDGRMPGPDNVPLSDPLIPLAYAAAITRKLRLGTGILILPQRHPVYVAKEVATLDVLSGGRAILGIGSGWLAEEFATVGVPFEERGARTDEAIRAIRTLWQPGPQSFEGKFFRWGPVESNPKPIQQPGVPIVIGGHSAPAARRAARLGDGFFPAFSDPSSLASLLDVMRAECQRVGRNPADIEITTGAFTVDAELVKRYAELGVHRVVIGPPGFDPDSIKDGLRRFADTVMRAT
ncbi:Alkanal monooxygenase alpha chain [bacterium HR30]|nr:Alkanal monooxygenase alpha chain [bacterium HR30]